VAAPPYDVLSTEEAITRAGDNQWSFLHVSRPEIDLPPGSDSHAPEAYAKSASNMMRMLTEGVLLRDAHPAYYVYRMEADGRSQTGLVAAASVVAYDAGRIRRHELTRPEKVEDRTRQIDALDAHTGPVMMAFRSDPAISALLKKISSRPAQIDVVADHGVRHCLWVVDDEVEISALTEAFNALEALYIADGHHRSEAALRVAQERQAANPNHRGDEPYNYFLSVNFPEDEVKIFDYNRVVRDLGPHDPEQFLAEIGKRFDVQPVDGAYRPDQPRRFGMYLNGRWYALSLPDGFEIGDDPVDRLDISLLSANLFAPILGIVDQRTDKRIDFVGGIRGLEGLESRVDSGEMAVAFSFYPTQIEDLMSVADSGREMPPKSTWFEPKLADGLISYPID
jgi:uncharacterized protein (DUF1015 family)